MMMGRKTEIKRMGKTGKIKKIITIMRRKKKFQRGS
jgi:hypothetical protein